VQDAQHEGGRHTLRRARIAVTAFVSDERMQILRDLCRDCVDLAFGKTPTRGERT
jgi:hypothetical protein